MVTGIDDPALANAAIEIGTYGYVIKPFTPNQVLIAVKNALSAPQARDREPRPARDARADRARAHSGAGALREAAEAFTRGDRAAPVPRGRVPRRGDRRPHRADERLFARCWPASSASTSSRSGSRARCTTSARSRSRTTSCCAPARSRPEERREMERHTLIGLPDPVRLRAARCSSWARRSRSRTTRSGTAPAIRAGWPATRSRSRARSRRSRTCSTRSPATVPTARRSRSSRPCEIMRGERGQHFDPRLVDLFLENVDELSRSATATRAPLTRRTPPASGRATG